MSGTKRATRLTFSVFFSLLLAFSPFLGQSQMAQAAGLSWTKQNGPIEGSSNALSGSSNSNTSGSLKPSSVRRLIARWATPSTQVVK